MKKNSLTKVTQKRLYLKNLIYADRSVFDALNKTWNSLPDDATPDERFIMIELIESTIKIYNNLRNEWIDKDNNLKN